MSVRRLGRALVSLWRAARLHFRWRFAPTTFISTASNLPSTVTDITAEELKARLAAGETPIIVDVREPWECEQSHLDAATTNIPLGSLPDRLDELAEYRDSELIIHCRSGARSATAKKFLEQQGFQQVRNLLGGIVGYA